MYRKAPQQTALQGDYIPRDQAISEPVLRSPQTNGFRSRKQQVLDTIIERMRAEKSALAYETTDREHKKNRAAPVSILRDYA